MMDMEWFPTGLQRKTFLFGLLTCRWWVATAVEPREMERRLLQQIDYPANYMQNGSRRFFGLMRQGTVG